MENKGYTLIQDWMLDLPLSLVETTLYAIVYGFSQDGESSYSGSLGYLARKCKVSKDTARRALHHLVESGYIERNEITKNGIKFNIYRHSKMQGVVANCEGGGSKMLPNNKEDNKDINKLTNKASRGFTPPTLTEIEAYCEERGNTVDAERFHNYYESNGWMVGKNRMKDWKAAVRTWEKSERSGAKAKPQAQSRISRLNAMAEQIMGGFKI